MKNLKKRYFILSGLVCVALSVVFFVFEKPPYLATKVVNGVKNPYGIQSHVYSIGTYATEEGGVQRAKNWKQYCFADMYSVSGISRENDIKSYLRQFDEKELREAYRRNSQTKYIDRKGIIVTTWIHPSELVQNIFSPVDETLRVQTDNKQSMDLSKQGNYLDFIACREFLVGITPTPSGYSLRVEEYFKSLINKKTYNQNMLSSVIKDSDTLVKMRSECERTEVEYYSKKYNVYVYTRTSLSTAYPKGSKKYSRKPSCNN